MSDLAHYDRKPPAQYAPARTPSWAFWVAWPAYLTVIAAGAAALATGLVAFTPPALVLGLLFIVFGFGFTMNHQVGWHCHEDERRRQLGRWRAKLGDEPFTPPWPLEGFVVLEPHQQVVAKDESKPTLEFSVRRFHWSGRSWSADGEVELAFAGKTSFDSEAGIEISAAAWVDFCAAVASANAKRFELEYGRRYALDAGVNLTTATQALALL